MGWLDSDNLEFDTENLRNQITVLQSLVDELNDAKDTLGNNLETLRNAWKTQAGLNFFKKYDEDWVNQLDAHIALVTDLLEQLKFASDSYDPLESEYRSITL